MHEPRENECKQVTIGFDAAFLFDKEMDASSAL